MDLYVYVYSDSNLFAPSIDIGQEQVTHRSSVNKTCRQKDIFPPSDSSEEINAQHCAKELTKWYIFAKNIICI